MNFTSKKILVVDDLALNRKMLDHLLSSNGHQVVLADSGETALAAANSEAFDVILMDVNLPGIDGIEATQTIRNRPESLSHSAQIIGISAHASRQDQQEFIQSGMDACLAKPIDLQQLLATIDQTQHLPAEDNESRTNEKILDVDDALARLNGDQSIYKKLIRVFCEDIVRLLESMDLAVDRNDANELATLAHRVRGMAANLSANECHQAATQLELNCRQDSIDWTDLGNRVDDLKSKIKMLEQAFVLRNLKP